MEKVIHEGDIVHASMEIVKESGKLKELFEKSPMLIFLVPVIAHEIEEVIFEKETED